MPGEDQIPLLECTSQGYRSLVLIDHMAGAVIGLAVQVSSHRGEVLAARIA